jgi:hypothetical protein
MMSCKGVFVVGRRSAVSQGKGKESGVGWMSVAVELTLRPQVNEACAFDKLRSQHTSLFLHLAYWQPMVIGDCVSSHYLTRRQMLKALMSGPVNIHANSVFKLSSSPTTWTLRPYSCTACTRRIVSPPTLPALRPSHRVANPLHLHGSVTQFGHLSRDDLKSLDIINIAPRIFHPQQRVAGNIMNLILQAVDVSEHAACQDVEAFGADYAVGVWESESA